MEEVVTDLRHLGVVLQLAIVPMILISSVGFVLFSLILSVMLVLLAALETLSV